jgi:hypothetical protein
MDLCIVLSRHHFQPPSVASTLSPQTQHRPIWKSLIDIGMGEAARITARLVWTLVADVVFHTCYWARTVAGATVCLSSGMSRT